MAYPPRATAVFPPTSSTASSLRQPSISSQNAQHSSALAARIAAKKSELENLRQLRDLSGSLAKQMGALEEKLATLRDGTEGTHLFQVDGFGEGGCLLCSPIAVACVLSNWDNVLRAISMASSKNTP